MLTGIGHVALRVRDFTACRTLYGDQLGLAEIAAGRDEQGRQVCMFRVGESILELWEDPDAPVIPVRDPFDPPPEPRPVPANVGHFSFLAGDNETVHATLKGRGLAPMWGPTVQPLDHAYMQRSLVEFYDPNGFTIQISEIVDPRDHLESRRAAKRACREAAPGDLLPAFDHFSMACTDFLASRTFYQDILGLHEFVHRTTAEPGLTLPAGFAQSVFAIGATDIEMSTTAEITVIRPGTVTRLGFWTDDLDQTYRDLIGRGAAGESKPAYWSPLPGIGWRSFTLQDPDGLSIQIAQKP